MKRTVCKICSLALLALLAGCSSETAEFGPARTLPKEKRPTVWGASEQTRLGLTDMSAASRTSQQSGGRQVIATVPDGWERVPGARQFRDANWRISGNTDTDCYLTLGVGGGLEMNMGRWYRNQFKQSTVPTYESLPVIELGDRTGRLAEIEGEFSGKQNWMALIAFYHQGQQVTSLKFTGPADVVKANKQKFLDLARSIRVASASKNPNAPPIRRGDKLPEGHAPVPGVTDPKPQDGGGNMPPGHGNVPPGHAAVPSPFKATVPDAWQPKAGSNKPLHYTFGRAGQVYVSSVGGSLRASFNIWRGEMSQQGQQLAPLSKEEFDALPKAMFLGEDAVMMDVSGDYAGMIGQPIQNARLMIIARAAGSSIEFCKMLGSAADVAAQRDAFVQFCGSVRKAQ